MCCSNYIQAVITLCIHKQLTLHFLTVHIPHCFLAFKLKLTDYSIGLISNTPTDISGAFIGFTLTNISPAFSSNTSADTTAPFGAHTSNF